MRVCVCVRAIRQKSYVETVSQFARQDESGGIARLFHPVRATLGSVPGIFHFSFGIVAGRPGRSRILCPHRRSTTPPHPACVWWYFLPSSVSRRVAADGERCAFFVAFYSRVSRCWPGKLAKLATSARWLIHGQRWRKENYLLFSRTKWCGTVREVPAACVWRYLTEVEVVLLWCCLPLPPHSCARHVAISN